MWRGRGGAARRLVRRAPVGWSGLVSCCARWSRLVWSALLAWAGGNLVSSLIRRNAHPAEEKYLKENKEMTK